MNNRKQVTLNRVFAAFLGITVLVLIISMLEERFGDSESCTLCKLQRIPYALIGLIAVLGIFTSIKNGAFKVIQVCLVASCFLGVFHASVQYGKINDPCARTATAMQNPQDYSGLLASGKNCSQISWALFGIPISLYNSLLSLLLLFGSRYLLSSNRRLTSSSYS
ncbi:MAG: Disulfide bond formation protein B [Chlamydiae bacterium]|nr:Disulfide bond formation protein B [Chlamydiota bacterium]